MSDPAQAPARNFDLKMTLAEHLGELRKRLLRVVIAVAILGGVALAFARPIFGLLMKPVLEALPPESRSLIYTSGIEEINVLMKVGLYAGVFLATPVLLWQLWGFVSPGLYPSERKYASPFIVGGTVAFLIGASFAYFLVLPQMFKFLLMEEDSAALQVKVEDAKLREEDALRALRFGDLDRAGALAKAASSSLDPELAPSFDPVASVANSPSLRLEVNTRLTALGRMMDAAHQGFGAQARPTLKLVMDKRLAAVDAFEKEDLAKADKLVEEAASALAAVSPAQAGAFGDLWRLERDLAQGDARHAALAWTKPMLSMDEQLGLVLLLELAFGIIFELPLVMALLSMLGIIKASFLFKYQRHAFVVILIITAIITPTGDAVNLALMCVPMFLCYELGVLAAWIIEKRRARTMALATPA